MHRGCDGRERSRRRLSSNRKHGPRRGSWLGHGGQPDHRWGDGGRSPPGGGDDTRYHGGYRPSVRRANHPPGSLSGLPRLAAHERRADVARDTGGPPRALEEQPDPEQRPVGDRADAEHSGADAAGGSAACDGHRDPDRQRLGRWRIKGWQLLRWQPHRWWCGTRNRDRNGRHRRYGQRGHYRGRGTSRGGRSDRRRRGRPAMQHTNDPAVALHRLSRNTPQQRRTHAARDFCKPHGALDGLHGLDLRPACAHPDAGHQCTDAARGLRVGAPERRRGCHLRRLGEYRLSNGSDVWRHDDDRERRWWSGRGRKHGTG
jgi:hypothetical protein